MNKVGLRELCSHGSSLFEIAYVPTQVIVCFLSHNGEGDIDLYNCQYENIWKILSGGSLGSYVDEGRSKMREIVWIAGHIEHRYSERKLQSKACLSSTPVWGSLLNHSILVLYKRVCECLHSLILVTTTLIVVVCVNAQISHLVRLWTTLNFWPQIRREYSLNLSILLSEGKETNKDSPSNGEWRGNSTMSNQCAFGAQWYVT